MDEVTYLVIGAGVSGLSFANWIKHEAQTRGRSLPNVLILEADQEPGGYCKTIKQDGFIWDYSGHFFHFKNPQVESWLRERMPGQDIRTVSKRTYVRFGGKNIDFPFQKNIHQLDQQTFIQCLVDLYFREQNYPQDMPVSTFKQMLYQRFGQGIAEAFLVPYNEKLYACDLNKLDKDAMGRFFPKGDADDIIKNMINPDNQSYNSTFTYPLGGAIEYINALLSEVNDNQILYNQRVTNINAKDKVVSTADRTFKYQHLISSASLPKLLDMCGMDYDKEAFSWNKVLVFNLGFDSKGADDVHWMYFSRPRYMFLSRRMV